MARSGVLPLVLSPQGLLGGIVREEGAGPLESGVWYIGKAVNDGLSYTFEAGAMSEGRFLTFDLLLDGVEAVLFLITLREGEKGRAFNMHYSALNQCSARVRMPLEAVNQNQWMYNREGAWLKPLCAGSRVDLAKVDRMTITLLRKGDADVRWCQTNVSVTAQEPARLSKPLLPKGPLVDELGQSRLRQWAGKSRSAEDVTQRLRKQLADAPGQRWPEEFSNWGGWAGRRVEAKGFFRTHHDGKRWWLVDPDGYLFWSAGMDCVTPGIDANIEGIEDALGNPPGRDGEFRAAYGGRRGGQSIDYLKVNFIRAFGAEKWREAWGQIALAELRRTGFNTVANWSDWQVARAAKFPYVRPLGGRGGRAGMIYRDFPDVFDAAFAEYCGEFAKQLQETADDPALIGYFLMNEPTWGFSSETPAAGMLFNTAKCATRTALAEHLRGKYRTDEGLSQAWAMKTTLAGVAEGKWAGTLTKQAEADLAAYSTVMVEKLFHGLSDACRAVDPNHLNLGARYHTVPPAWALAGMTCFDVFSVNCYQERVPHDKLRQIDAQLRRPVLVGEWHFGALDVGLPASGIGRVASQADRGKAFRVYEEDAAAQTQCIGVHYFTLYDQSALGRFDGENYNIGFVDICSRPYEELAAAARAAHERLYAVASGQAEAYADTPRYLPKLFY